MITTSDYCMSSIDLSFHTEVTKGINCVMLNSRNTWLFTHTYHVVLHDRIVWHKVVLCIWVTLDEYGQGEITQ